MKNIYCIAITIFLFASCPGFVFCQAGADSLVSFIKKNPSRSSLFLRSNDTVITRLNEDKLMPVAGTVDIIVAIEFAKQASHHIFNENERVPLADVNKYYIAATDHNAHLKWLDYEKKLGKIINDSVKLIDVARGMILFNSNANSEYLMDLLGFENVTNNIRLFGLKKHSPVYPFTASLFLYQNPKKLNEDKILKEIGRLSDEQYEKAAFLVHRELKNDSTYKKKFRLQDFTAGTEKEWSRRLPRSTTREYVQLCSILNNRKYFDENTYSILSTVLESSMEDAANKTWLLHLGMKGDSTNLILTRAFYAMLKNGAKVEMACFFNDLTTGEIQRLQNWMNDFQVQLLSNENFRRKIVL
jgi:D-alanyl-D-alanine carboxypeptidase